MKFFKPEDFADLQKQYHMTQNTMADIANAKLEREGKVVYSDAYFNDGSGDFSTTRLLRDTHKALLINIEPLSTCRHPPEKVNAFPLKGEFTEDKLCLYECSCGAKVKAMFLEEK